MTRPKIYALLASATHLPPQGGDRINEARFLSALSTFADVYYNQQLFKPDAENFGLEDIPIEVPSDNYDLYYVRANKAVFEQLPHPKAYLGLPYDADVYRTADAVFTTTATWADMLQRFSPEYPPKSWRKGWYEDDIVRPRRIINIGQTADSAFRPEPSHFETFKYRAIFGYGFVIGYFGRIGPDTVPNTYYGAVSKLHQNIPHLTTIFAGNITVPVPKHIRVVERIPYSQMPYAINACNLVIYDCGPDGNWLGSGKVIDAIRCEVPILLPRTAIHLDLLGEDYPLFSSDSDELARKILQFYNDKGFEKDVRARIALLSEELSPQRQIEIIKPKIISLIQEATRSSA